MAKDKQSPEYTSIPQMTFKKCGLTPKDAIKHEKPVYMCRVFGEASGVKTKESRSGDPYSYLMGEFRLINAKGEKFESAKLFLPGSLFEVIEAALTSAEGRPVVFAYDVSSVPSDATIGYQYGAKSLIKTTASDKLTELTAQVVKLKQDEKSGKSAE